MSKGKEIEIFRSGYPFHNDIQWHIHIDGVRTKSFDGLDSLIDYLAKECGVEVTKEYVLSIYLKCVS